MRPIPLRTVLRRAAAEPFVHFLLLGALGFGLWPWFGGTSTPQRIVVSSFDLERMRALAERQWGKTPDAQHMEKLVEAHIREEVLVREAQAAGLARDDVIVRRRLAQKMEFLAQEDVPMPDDAALRQFLAAHVDRYRAAPSITFEQKLVSRRLHGAQAEARAHDLLARLQDGQAGTGDSGLVPPAHAAMSRERIAAEYGEDMAGQLAALAPGRWSGPFASPFGLHLVRVSARTAADAPSVEALRGQLATDWRNAEIARRREAAYQRLRSKYEIDVAGGQAVAAVSP